MRYLRNPRNVNLFVRAPHRKDRWPRWAVTEFYVLKIYVSSTRRGRGRKVRSLLGWVKVESLKCPGNFVNKWGFGCFCSRMIWRAVSSRIMLFFFVILVSIITVVDVIVTCRSLDYRRRGGLTHLSEMCMPLLQRWCALSHDVVADVWCTRFHTLSVWCPAGHCTTSRAPSLEKSISTI